VINKKDKGLVEYVTNNENLQNLNLKLMKRIGVLTSKINNCCDAIVVMEEYVLEKERFEKYLKGGFSHECPF
jgi:hypothetical protein